MRKVKEDFIELIMNTEVKGIRFEQECDVSWWCGKEKGILAEMGNKVGW